ncbi:dihydropteroate synthase [Siphonobacter curvatus]|uniref:Dihydropteroate synthase n=1 Tax=Siphonobacter curvatus TaxID=2094562 RepID=A0A2S7ILU5_9BACT|nr:dihydropteroate synthase [Siphonobacter curvatus]PQA58598.1 dihydropteroate synthase [Siphonobacter curvatus]
MQALLSTPSTLNCRGQIVSLKKPVVMGILNITPDSFHAGSRFEDPDRIRQQAQQMLAEGATFLDIGGYSTRPGAAEVSEAEEVRRVVLAIDTILKAFPKALISVDTFRSGVARRAVEAGAVMVNDVSGGLLDQAMFTTVAELNVPYVLMHMRGTPQTMGSMNQYQNLLTEVIDELAQRVHLARQAGIKDIILDPGFGFAKNADQNYQLLAQVEALQIFQLPLLIGLSRKSMIWKKLGISPAEALNGTTVLNTIALQKGAKILRVHDVREACEVIQIMEWMQKA